MKKNREIEPSSPVGETAAKESRRRFLKKAAYTAPKLIVLGYMAKPKSGFADFSGSPDGPPTGWTP